MKLRTYVAMMAIAASTTFPLALRAQSVEPTCHTDALHRHLKAAYPEGVPGRNLPAPSAKTDYNFDFVIPVVVHIMHDYGPEYFVNESQVRSQIDVLNATFNNASDGADAQITFCLATRDPEGNPTDGYEFYHYPETENLDPYTRDTIMKRTTQWDPNRYLNIWVVRQIANGQIKGYAYFPDEVAGTIWDGYVVAHPYFGRQAGTAVALGRTGTHEVGHYLSLYHPWGLVDDGTGCYGSGDGCADTPPVEDTHFALFPGCNAPQACDGNPRQIENYMDYSAEGCMSMFTECQADRMRSAIVTYRPKLIDAQNIALTGCAEAADTMSAQGDLLLFPVPAKDVILALPAGVEASSVWYQIHDHSGRVVQEARLANLAKAPLAIDVTGLPNGIYLIEIEAGARTWVEKFMIDR